MRNFLITIAILAAVVFAANAGDITGTGYYWGDVVTYLTNTATIANEAKADYNLLLARSKTGVLTNSAFAKAGASSNVFSIGATDYMINDLTYTAAATNTLTVAGAIVGLSQDVYFLISLDSSGNATATKGTTVTYGSTPLMPAVPANYCPIGLARVQINAGGASFTLGTSNFDVGSGTTVTATAIRWPTTGSSAPTAVAASDLTLTGL